MKRTVRLTSITFCCLALLNCATGNKAHQEGLMAFQRGEYQSGIEMLEEAVRQDPANMTYRLDLKTKREQAIQALIAEGDAARAAGDLNAAEFHYNRILSVETRNGRALRGLEAVAEDRAHAEMIAQARILYDGGEVEQATARLRAVVAENPGVRAAWDLLEKIDAAKGPANITPTLHTINDAPVTLQFRDADTQMVFEVLSRQTGINFIFDKDVRRDSKTTIFVRDVRIDQAIDLVLGQNQLGRQIMSENMVLIYPNTPVKQQEYQDQIVKTFYMTNSDPQQFSEMLKTMLNAKTIFVEPRSGAVVMRDTPELIRMAENLLASVDVPDAEVMMEVEVLEITRTKMQQLGIAYPTDITLNPTPLAGDPLVLADLRNQDSTTITVTPVPVTIDLKKEVGDSNLLASPRIRARNHEEARVLIGQRVPVITNSVTPTANGQSVVTGNVEYVDVGLTLNVTPTIHLDNEVAIDVELEVSNIIREIFNSTSGTLAYQIGTRNAETILRLRNGETQILAGLIQDIDRETSNRVPGLGDMPILGRLFRSDKTSAEKTEIVLSITPRIIRAQPRPASDFTEFWYGTEASLRSSPLATVSTSSRNAVRASNASYTMPTVNRAGNSPSGGGGPDQSPDAPPPDRLSLSWDGPGQVSVGQNFTVTLLVNSVTELSSLRTQLRYDPAALELSSMEVGEFVPPEARSAAIPSIRERAGRAQLDIANTGDETASGSGALAILNFRAVAARPATMIAVQQFAASGTDNLAVPAIAPRPFVVVVGQ